MSARTPPTAAAMPDTRAPANVQLHELDAGVAGLVGPASGSHVYIAQKFSSSASNTSDCEAELENFFACVHCAEVFELRLAVRRVRGCIARRSRRVGGACD